MRPPFQFCVYQSTRITGAFYAKISTNFPGICSKIGTFDIFHAHKCSILQIARIKMCRTCSKCSLSSSEWPQIINSYYKLSIQWLPGTRGTPAPARDLTSNAYIPAGPCVPHRGTFYPRGFLTGPHLPRCRRCGTQRPGRGRWVPQ